MECNDDASVYNNILYMQVSNTNYGTLYYVNRQIAIIHYYLNTHKILCLHYCQLIVPLGMYHRLQVYNGFVPEYSMGLLIILQITHSLSVLQ